MIFFTINDPNIEKIEINFTLQADSAGRIDQFFILLKTNTKNSLNVGYPFPIFSIPANDIEIIIRYSYSFCLVFVFTRSVFPRKPKHTHKKTNKQTNELFYSNTWLLSGMWIMQRTESLCPRFFWTILRLSGSYTLGNEKIFSKWHFSLQSQNIQTKRKE